MVSERFIRAVPRVLIATTLLSGVAGLYLKQRIIGEMHSGCAGQAVWFDSLGAPALVCEGTARAYHIATVIFFGSVLPMLGWALLRRKRKPGQRNES